jgi:hypothetical protein
MVLINRKRAAAAAWFAKQETAAHRFRVVEAAHSGALARWAARKPAENKNAPPA